ncbi:uncharacterized protein LOC144666234 isoform X2 [Oculina patagonica]
MEKTKSRKRKLKVSSIGLQFLIGLPFKKVDLSFSHGLKTLQDQLMEEPLEDSLRGSERVVRLQIISTAFCPVLRDKGVPALVRAGLKVDVFGIENSHPPEGNQGISKALASPIVIAMNDVERAMEKLGYSLYKGEVYKKVQSSKYTFSHCCTVKRFLSVLGTNENYKETIVKHLHKLDSLLSDPESEFGKQMKIDFDLIEVSDGWCFSLSRREFVENAICHTDVGQTSPRAFVEYTRDKLPDVTFFQEILENSLSEEEIGHFCEYFVRLLNYGTKQHKEKVLCLVGEPNSGKTSLFAPIAAIIPQRYIAMITKQKAFNKSLIDQQTQIIFLDEAYAGLLEPDDWKVLTQGGLMAPDRKFKSSKAMNIRCPMFITCQSKMDFGEEHNAAMEVRLRKFQFKTLKSPPVAGVQKFLKDHAMDCIVWAATKAVEPEDELPRPPKETRKDDEPFGEEEKARIKNLTFDESDKDSEGNIADDPFEETSQESDESLSLTDEQASPSFVNVMEKELDMISKLCEKEPPHSLKRRQLEVIGANVKQVKEDCRNQEEERKAQFLNETKARWIAVGMLREEDANLLESVDGPYHPNIEKTREEYFANKRAEEERALEERAQKYYEDEWVIAKEKELQDLQTKEDTATDQDTKRALAYVMQVAVDALKGRFMKEDVPRLKKYVLMERKRVAVELGWCSRDQAATIQSIWCPLPYPREQESEEDLYITQSSQPSTSRAPSQYSHRRNSKKRRASQSSQVAKRGQITHFFKPTQE